MRTSVGVSHQIYSLPPLATRAPLLSESRIMPLFSRGQQAPHGKLPFNGILFGGHQPTIDLAKMPASYEWLRRPGRRQWRGMVGLQDQVSLSLHAGRLNQAGFGLRMRTP